MGFNVREGLHVEQIDSGVLVLPPRSDRVLRLEGAQAAAFALAQTGAGDVPDDLVAAMAGLVALGIVETDVWSRRRVLQLGGAAAAAAVAAVALPSIAAADSHPGTDPGTTTTTSTLPRQEPGLYISSYQSYNVMKWPGSGTALSVGVPRDPIPPQGPAGLAVGPDDRLYIANAYNDTITAWNGRSASTTPVVLQGQGLKTPFGLAFDTAGKLYIGNLGGTSSWVSIWEIGSGTSASTVITSGIGNPSGLAFGPDGTLYIADSYGSTVSKWTPGSGTAATPFLSGLSYPTGLAFDSVGNLYIADQSSGSVKKWDFASSTLSTVVTGLSYPQALYMDASDHLYIATYDNKVKFWNGSSTSAVTIASSDLSLPAGLAWF